MFYDENFKKVNPNDYDESVWKADLIIVNVVMKYIDDEWLMFKDGKIIEHDIIMPEQHPKEQDYEFEYTASVFRKFTEEELEKIDLNQKEEEERQDHQDLLDALPDAVADLSESVSNGAMDTADLADAIADLSELVSRLIEGE